MINVCKKKTKLIIMQKVKLYTHISYAIKWHMDLNCNKAAEQHKVSSLIILIQSNFD